MKGFFLFLCFIYTTAALSQSSKITGKVIDSTTREAVEYATIAVTDKVSKNIINGAISNGKGLFEVTGLPPGSYFVTVEFIGYAKKTIDNVLIARGSGSVSLNTILLAPAGKMLHNVTVTASAPIVENKIDKMVYNAANDITSQGGQALDVLKKVPQVSVEIDGNVELQGNSNIRFLINGKPSSVFGNSITDALAAIPASQIKSIEVITSPGAKYDAQGTGGIINIILKDNKMQGINGSINLSGGTRLENGSANLNFRHNNFGFNAFLNGNAQLASRTPSSQNRTSYDSVGSFTNRLQQNGYTDFQRNGYQSGVSFDWNLTKKDNITAAISYNHLGNQSEGIINVLNAAADTATVNSRRSSFSHFDNNSLDWSMNYKKTFKKENQELSMLYSASYGQPDNSYQQSTTYNGLSNPYSGSQSNNPGTSRENNISVDYTHPITEHFMLETGAKTTLQSITSQAEVKVLQPDNKYLQDPGQSYNLKYDMQVYAAYLSASFPLTTFLKVKTGARYEYTETKIDFPNTTIPAFGTLVPSVILSHDFKEGQFIKLAYTRRIERAEYRDVNPFLNFADPYNIWTGNPELKPEIGNNTELGYNKSFGKSGNLYIALIERINTQDHKMVTTYYDTLIVNNAIYTNVSVYKVENIGTEYNSGVNVSGSWTIKDKLSLRGNVFFTHRHSVGLPPGSYGSDGDRFRANLNASYQFPHDLVTEIFGNYHSASNNVQGRTPQSITYTIACRKQFWNKNASLGITATNIFNEYTKQVTTITSASYSSYSIRQLPYRSVGISFTYKFGKLEFKKDKENNSYLNNPPAMDN